jgi:uncharacterized membrane protein required for colicin V production
LADEGAVSGVDLVILGGLAFFLVRGLLNGFVGELAPVAGLVAGVAAGVGFAGDVALWGARQWSWAAGLAPGLLLVVAGAACFGLAYAACRLAVLLLAGTGDRPGASGGFARAGGALLGLLKGALVVGFALLGLSWLLAGPVSHRLLASSVLARGLTRLSSSLLTWAHGWL